MTENKEEKKEQISQDQKSKTTRLRSPSYPGVNLESAIKYAREFYDHEKRNAANVEIALKHWNFKPKSGGGYIIVAALKAFGLMTDTGSGPQRKVQLTELAFRILLDTRAESEEREAAIKQAALMPKIHASLWNKYKNDAPSDENLRHELIFERKFNENTVSEFIKIYKDTIRFSKINEYDTIPDQGEDKYGETGMEENSMMEQLQPGHDERSKLPKSSTPPVVGRPVGQSIPVTQDCSMSVIANGPVTKKGIDQLMAYLKLIRESFPED